MEPGGRTGERLEMVAAKVGNSALVSVVDELDSLVARIECLCSVYFHPYYVILLHCHLGVVVSQTAHWFKP